MTKEKPNSFFYILNTLKRVEKNYQAYVQISNNFYEFLFYKTATASAC